MVCIAGSYPATEKLTVVRIWTFRAATLIFKQLYLPNCDDTILHRFSHVTGMSQLSQSAVA